MSEPKIIAWYATFKNGTRQSVSYQEFQKADFTKHYGADADDVVTTPLVSLADWQAEHAARVAAEADVQVARGQYQGACDVIRKLEFQLTILCEQGRQHQAFQEWTNQTEALRLNDARREGWKAHAANGRLVLPAVTFDYRAGILDGSSGKTEQYDEGFCDGVKAMRDHIRAMQPPTEWVNPPATLTNEGAKWPHPDGFAGGLMGETG